MRSCGVLECQYALSASAASSKEDSTENVSLSTLKVSIVRIVFISLPLIERVAVQRFPAAY